MSTEIVKAKKTKNPISKNENEFVLRPDLIVLSKNTFASYE